MFIVVPDEPIKAKGLSWRNPKTSDSYPFSYQLLCALHCPSLTLTIVGYWEEWYERAVEGRYSQSDPSRPFPCHSLEQEHSLTDVRPELFRVIRGTDSEEELFVPDLGKIGILGAKWLVSRKRNTNLLDLSNVWKKIVFQKIDEDIAQQGGVVPNDSDDEMYTDDLAPGDPRNDEESAPADIHLHRRSPSLELEHHQFGRSSKMYQR